MDRPEPEGSEGLGLAAPNPPAFDNQTPQQGPPSSLVKPGVAQNHLLLKSVPSLTRVPSAGGILDALSLLSSPRSSPRGPRSKSPLPARPTSSPRSNATTISNSSVACLTLPSRLSPTMPSVFRSTGEALPDKLMITNPSSPSAFALSSPPSLSRGLSASPMVGDLHLIKEEENEDQSECSRSRRSSTAIGSSTSSTSSASSSSSSSPAVIISSGTRSDSSSCISFPLPLQISSLSSGEAAAVAAGRGSTSPNHKQRVAHDSFQETTQAGGLIFIPQPALAENNNGDLDQCQASFSLISPLLPSSPCCSSTSAVHEGLVFTPEEKKECFKVAETKKQQLDLPSDTFAQNIPETITANEAPNDGFRAKVGLKVEEEGVIVPEENGKEGRKKREGGKEKSQNVWDRLYKSQTTSPGKKERQQKEHEARFTFQPALATAAAAGGREGGRGRRSPTISPKSATSSSSSSSSNSSGSGSHSKKGVHDRLYAEGKNRLQRLEERLAKPPPGCTFHPIFNGSPGGRVAAATDAAAAAASKITEEGEGGKNGGSTRGEGKYLHGKEKVGGI